MKQSEEKHNGEWKNDQKRMSVFQVIGQANGIRMQKGMKKKNSNQEDEGSIC